MRWMEEKSRRASRVLVCCALMSLGFASLAAAAAILPGFDALHTPPGGAFLPSPFGTIPLMSAPFSPALGNTDTLVERFDSLGPGATGTIDAEIVALSLRSITPVPISSSLFNVFVTLDSSRASRGNLTVTSHDDVALGGTFNSHFDVFVKAIFKEVGNPSNTFTVLSDSDGDAIDSTGSAWSHLAPPFYPSEGTLFDLPSGDPPFISGDFFPGVFVDPILGPVPVGIVHTGPHPQTVPARVPVPSSLLLLGGGLATLAAFGRKRLRR